MYMKILVVGGYGAQGQVICRALVKNRKVSEVMCSGRRIEQAKKFVSRYKNEKLSAGVLDLNNINEIRAAVKNVDLVLNAASYLYNLRLMKACAQSGVNYQDLASAWSIETMNQTMEEAIGKEVALDQRFKDVGAIALISTGEDPGISDVIAGHAADSMDHLYEIRMKDCGVLKTRQPLSTWAPELLWRDMTTPAIVFRDGKYKRVPPFSEEEIYRFPDPVGLQPCYQHLHEEPVTLPIYLKGLRYVEFKMCGPDMPFAKALYDYGLAKKEAIDVKGTRVAPLDVFLAVSPKPLTQEETRKKIQDGTLEDEICCLLLDLKGERKGREVKWTVYTTQTLKEVNQRMPGATSTSYLVGIGSEVFAELLAEKRIRTKGVAPPEALTANEKVAVIQRLASKGIKIQRVESVVL
jgi:saccharopine dehydrogenase-like NADP-dependent oxidoreductase